MKKLLPLALLVPALALAIADMKWFDLNHWSAPFYNDGRWGIDTTGALQVPGAAWPQPLHNCYVFGAGAWVGAVIDSAPPETLCTFLYNPNTGGSEAYPTLCRDWNEGDTNALDRIYQYRGDWPPPLSRFPMAPQDPRSDMDLWCCLCDSDPAKHISPGRPLGIDVYLTVFGFDDSLAQDFFYLKCELANCSGDSIHNAYFGAVLDADIGDATDDMTSLILDHSFEVGQETIRVRNTGFAYDYNNYEAPGTNWDSGTPGAIAVMLLESPESLGLTAFKSFILSNDPTTDAAQYLSLAGYDWQTGTYIPYDSLDSVPGDKRMLLATGPFDLAPDSVLTFSYAVIGSPFGDSGQAPAERDTSELALRCKWAREFFEQPTGVAERTPSAEVRRTDVGPTLVHGVLRVPASSVIRGASCVLLDISGRKVMNLRSGANDVGALAPGIYFVRGAPYYNGPAPRAYRVVITR